MTLAFEGWGRAIAACACADARGLQRRHNAVHHAFEFVTHVRRPKAQHGESRAPKICVPRPITCALSHIRVLNAIHFNDELGFEAGEVNDVAALRNLPAEMPAPRL